MLKQAIALSTLSLLLFSILSYSEVYSTSNSNARISVMIGFKAKPDDSLVKAYGGSIKYNFHPFINVIAASIPEKAIDALSRNPKVYYVELDGEVHALGHTPANPNIEYQNAWGVDHIQADAVHAYSKGANIYVCIVDTGIDYNHPDLAGRYKGGRDYVNSDNDPMDDNGHGTHVSGTVAAVLNNVGVVGVAPDAYLYGVKVLNKQGSGWWSDVAAGIKWCADNNANIISMSLGGGYSASVESAVNAAYSKGLLLVAAAGNSGAGTDTVIYPAKFESVMAVAATDQSDNRASFSSTGPSVEISAPGVGVKSTVLAGGYASYSGTSMATPHVSGVAALIWFSYPSLTNVQVRNVLDNTAQDLGPAGRDNYYGYGLVRADLAVPSNTNPSPTAPSAPSNLQAAAGDGQVTLNWLAPNNNGGSAITKYNIYRGTSSNGEQYLTYVGAGTLSYMDTAVNNAQTYYYYVKAENFAGESLASNEASATPQASSSPAPPPTPSKVSVSSITSSGQGGKSGNQHIVIVASLLDDLNNAVSGASVSINVLRSVNNGPYSDYGSASGTTGTDGKVTFKVVNAPSGCYKAVVTSVIASGLTWDGLSPDNTYCK